MLISSSNYAERQLNVCSGGDLCSPFFSNFSETPCMKVGFNVRISLRLMNEGRFPAGGRFHFLLPSQTCREQPFSHAKNKASAHE